MNAKCEFIWLELFLISLKSTHIVYIFVYVYVLPSDLNYKTHIQITQTILVLEEEPATQLCLYFELIMNYLKYVCRLLCVYI